MSYETQWGYLSMLASFRKMGTRTWRKKEMTWAFFVLQLSHLFHPPTEMVQGIWVDVSIGDKLGKIKVLRMSSVHWAGGSLLQSRLTSSKGMGCFSLLTKKTPLFLRALGQSVWMMRWPAVFWEITIDCGSSLSRKACAKNAGILQEFNLFVVLILVPLSQCKCTQDKKWEPPLEECERMCFLLYS